MQRAEVFVTTENAMQRKSKKKYGYVLECQINGKPYTREGFGSVEATYHQCVLVAINEALKRFKKPAEIVIHTEDEFIVNMLEKNLEQWAVNGFVNAKKRKVANAEEWQQLYENSKEHLILTAPGKHEYTGWIQEEMKK